MDPKILFARYQDLQRYVSWELADEDRVRAIAPSLLPCFPHIVEDFYEEIERHPEARRVITGGRDQIERLKRSLLSWVEELFFGEYDADYVARRWNVGLRHVQVGLSQVYVNVAMSRMRSGLLSYHGQISKSPSEESLLTRHSINKLIDLDLAIIEDAYQTEFLERQRRVERLATIGEVTGGMLEIVPTFVLLLDCDGGILKFNAHFEELTGYKMEAVIGRNFFDLFLPERERQRIRDTFHSLIQSNQVFRATSAIVQRSGQEIEVRWSAKVLPHRDNAILGILASGQDITELKQAQEKALQHERLAAIGETMTGLVHESRNALQRTHACLEMLADEVADRPAALDFVKRAQRAQDDLRLLFEEVREYAAPIRLECEECDLASIWRQAWHDLEHLHQPKHLQLSELTSDVDLHRHVDRFAVGQVFRNILENAIHASPENGQISVHCEGTLAQARPRLRISIHDDGPGIPAGFRRRVLDPFFTTKSKGTGLGLAIARRIVQSHGGEIAVADTDGQGATIFIDLPRESR